MERVQEVAESQRSKEEDKDASAAAGVLEKLSVEDKAGKEKAEEKPKEETKEKAPAAGKEKVSESEDKETAST